MIKEVKEVKAVKEDGVDMGNIVRVETFKVWE